MSEELQHFWNERGAAFVTVPGPRGALAELLSAHDVIVVRPDRIVYAVAPTAVDLLKPREPTVPWPRRVEEQTR
jgi:hypothetical protein